MPSTTTLLAFLTLSVGLVLAPGPSTMFLLSQGMGRGRRPALASWVGVEVAGAVRVLATAAGLSALLASSAVVFDAVRWAGVIYLVFLGGKALLMKTPASAPVQKQATSSRALATSVGRGFVVAMGNPKMLIFCVALFPQFIHADRGPAVEQILILGGLLWVMGVVWDGLITVWSGRIGAWIARRSVARRIQSGIEAATYLGMAGWSAFS